ncbi:hypothetical protein EDD11_006867 [Mortierella claussenii]|nr:hypothetical protein EDD11_006867 [Mortierella claussenii]
MFFNKRSYDLGAISEPYPGKPSHFFLSKELRRQTKKNASRGVQNRQLELERQSRKQLKVTKATVGNFRIRDKNWKEAMARYVGKGDEEAEVGDSSDQTNTGDEHEDDDIGSNYNP